MTVSWWAYRAAREGVNLPVPGAVLERLCRRLAGDSLEDLRIRPASPTHLSITGRRKAGIWIEFNARFRLEAPGPDDPPRGLVLVPEKIQPFPVKSPMLAALAALDGVDRQGERLRLNLDHFMEGHQWGRRIPAALRNRVRIADVRADERSIRLQLRVSHRAVG
ncbi:hypothetical protein [Thiohalobacter thiocyanaticus]|uniref:Uncharacterized protein n=1 Tax=Thiohalobacter thiocyanaticus TaxID=585455 RepID=A0A426QJX4_9GAMM|nr:hypothetical protein [Thiohalobacter thiocyanaticus]RRQ22040.1 hypothetical protein D6C00_08810 [Thiohalobacter thiocyanaticus]